MEIKREMDMFSQLTNILENKVIKKNFITMKNIGTTGRLGNQMFQFAILRKLATKLDLIIKLPVKKSSDPYFCFKLDDVFDLKFDRLSCQDILKIKTEYQEKHFHFDPNVFS